MFVVQRSSPAPVSPALVAAAIFICLPYGFRLFSTAIKALSSSYAALGHSAILPAPVQSACRGRGVFVPVARLLVLVLSLTLICRPLQAQKASAENLPNLTLANLFTDGWDQTWIKRQVPGGAPDMALLRVQTNFLAQDVRADFLTQQDLNSTKNRTVDLFDVQAARSFNRRVMITATVYDEWLNTRGYRDFDAANFALAGRLLLVDIPGSSYAMNLKVISPAKNIGNDLTTVTYALAGWEDLTPWGWTRMGLYFSLQGDSYVGPHIIGSKETDTAYDVSLAKTWTEPTAALPNFTTFAEIYGQTDLSGSNSGKTVITLTPGFRTGLGHGQVVMAGVDLPVSHPRPYGWELRVAYIFNY